MSVREPVIALGALLGAAILWSAVSPLVERPRFLRRNFRGSSIPTAAGVVVMIVVAAGSLMAWIRPESFEVRSRWAAASLILAVAFGILGLIDDLSGQAGGGGFRGHLLALARGRLTTGMLKLMGGGVVSLVAAYLVLPDGSVVDWIRAGLLVALSANLANLFDRAPLRTTKVAVLWLLALVPFARGSELLAGVLAVGASLGLAPWEGREKLMVGDTGANVVGASLGLSAVLALGPVGQWITLGLVGALNLISERVSFSRVIAGNRVLSALDRLARLRP